MTREELIELALTGSKNVEQNEEATNIYVDIAEHLLSQGHASTITEIDMILEGMDVDGAEAILSSAGSPESLSEGHAEVAGGLESDPEGYMVLRQMATAENACLRIRTYIGNDKMLQLPAWVQSKVTTAADYLDTVADYLLSDTAPTE